MSPAAQIGIWLGRRETLKYFINLTRWLRTVHEMHLLPPAPSLQMYSEVPRQNPYNQGKCHTAYHVSLLSSCRRDMQHQILAGMLRRCPPLPSLPFPG